jgi:RNA polymerase sigma factor (sigma-70 family)
MDANPKNEIDPTKLLARMAEDFGVIVKTVRKKAGVSREDAEDATQEAFLKLGACMSKGERPRVSAQAWVRTVALHKAMDSNEKRSNEIKRGIERVKCGMVRSDFETAADESRSTESQEALETALNALAPDVRFIINAYFYNNDSQEEIARDLGISRRAVSKRLVQVLRELERQLEAL